MNCPEGTAVSVPLRREGLCARQGVVVRRAVGLGRPVAAVAGALAVGYMRPLLPYALAFAAGAMIFVVVEEVVPESQSGGHADLATLGRRFAVMMTLDVALGCAGRVGRRSWTSPLGRSERCDDDATRAGSRSTALGTPALPT